MKILRIASLVLAALLLMGGAAEANWMGNIQLEYDSPSCLGQGERLHIDFDYNITEPGGARFYVLPYTNGSPTPGFSWSGSTLHAQGLGSLTTWCAVNAGSPVVDHYWLAMVSEDWNTTYLELFIPVEYVIGEHGICNIRFDHGQPSWLGNGQDLLIDFDYRTTAGEVLIFARPFTDGALTPGYSASGSAIHYGPTGSGQQHFTFDSGWKDVDAVRFQMKTTDLSQVLLEWFVPVDFHWGPHGVSNIVHTPPPGQHRQFEEDTYVDFDYYTSDPNGVRIWAQAYNADGSYLYDSYYMGSPLESGPEGSAQRYFGVNDTAPPSEVAYTRFIMTNEDQSETYLDVLVPSEFGYASEAVRNVSFWPGELAILDQNEDVEVTFDYVTSQPEGVRIYPRPFTGGELSDAYAAGGSPLYPWESGAGSNHFTITSGETLVDQCRFRVWNYDNTEILHDMFYPTRHYFGHSAVATGLPGAVPDARPELYAPLPNPFNPKTTLSFRLPSEQAVRLAVYDVRGRLVRELLAATLPAGEHSAEWDGRNGRGEAQPSGVYFYRLETATGPLGGKAVLLK